MGFFNTKNTLVKEIHDGYCVLTLKDKYLKKLKKNFNKQADIDYYNFQKSIEENIFPVAPTNFNANAAKYRMQMESAIDDGTLVAIKIDETEDEFFDLSDYKYIETQLTEKNVEFMMVNDNNEKIILCNNDEKNINTIKNVVYQEILFKREEQGKNIIKKDGFLNKKMSLDEQNFVKENIAQQIIKELYNGDINLALALLNNNEQLVKIIVQEKHKKDIEKLLIHLQIEHLLFNDSLIIGLQNVEYINSTIEDYVHGAIIIKDKNVYGLKIKKEVQQQTVEKDRQSIDNIIDRLQDKKRDSTIIKNYGEITK